MKPILEGFVTAFADGKRYSERSVAILSLPPIQSMLSRFTGFFECKLSSLRDSCCKTGTPLQAAQALLAQVMSGNELWS